MKIKIMSWFKSKPNKKILPETSIQPKVSSPQIKKNISKFAVKGSKELIRYTNKISFKNKISQTLKQSLDKTKRIESEIKKIENAIRNKSVSQKDMDKKLNELNSLRFESKKGYFRDFIYYKIEYATDSALPFKQYDSKTYDNFQDTIYKYPKNIISTYEKYDPDKINSFYKTYLKDLNNVVKSLIVAERDDILNLAWKPKLESLYKKYSNLETYIKKRYNKN